MSVMKSPWPNLLESFSRSHIAERLKVCPVCQTLNSLEALECFVCAWHGRFELESSIVESRLEELVARCPELSGVIDPPKGFFNRTKLLAGFLLSRLRRRIDLTI